MSQGRLDRDPGGLERQAGGVGVHAAAQHSREHDRDQRHVPGRAAAHFGPDAGGGLVSPEDAGRRQAKQRRPDAGGQRSTRGEPEYLP